MEDGRPRNAWLRMTDMMGLTEPGKKPQKQSPRVLLFLTVLWSLSTIAWLVQVIRDYSIGATDYFKVVLAVSFFVLAVANYVMWRKSKSHRDESRNERDF
ncbi:hypothetical protein V3C33_08395 [Micrococcaceae bacterium Sec5.7]